MGKEKSIGQDAFEAYKDSVSGVTYDARPIPDWENLSDSVRRGWDAAALKVRTRTLLDLKGMLEMEIDYPHEKVDDRADMSERDE